MNLKATVLATLVLLTAGVSLAQTKREIMEEDPKLSPNLRIELTPLNMYTAVYNSIQWSVRASYRYNNKFSISGEFRREYYDEQEADLKETGNRTYGKPVSGTAYEVIGTYFFSSKEKEVEEWMPVKHQSIGNNTVKVTVDPIPMTRLALYGVRFGYGSMKGTNPMYGTLTEVGNPANTFEDGATPLQTTGLIFGGLNATRIKNVKVKYPNYGIKRKQVMREYYLDGIYAASNKYSTVEEDKGTGMKSYNVMAKSQKLGGRLGVFSTKTGRLINFGYGFEVGLFPGTESSSSEVYINFRLAFSLFQKLGLSEE